MDAKSIPGSLRSFQNRPKINPGSVFGVIKAPKELAEMIRSVPDAARDRPGSTRRVPKSVPVKKGGFLGVPGSVQKRAEAINFDADSSPGAKKSSFFRTAGSHRPVGAIFR